MKKSKKTQLTALMFAAALAAGCQNPIQDDGNVQAVYGPAPDPTVSFTTERDEMQEVYGPPVEDETTDEETTDVTETSAESETTGAFAQTYAPIYGPPEDVGGEEPTLAEDESVTETLSPTSLPVLIYGPPPEQ